MGWIERLFGGGRAERRPVEPPTPASPPAPRPAPKELWVAWRAGSWPTEVVGESYRQDALEAICGGRTIDGHNRECVAKLRLDPGNKHDPNAVKVLIDGHHVGFLSRDEAPRYKAALIAAGLRGRAAHCSAVIRGGWRDGEDDGDFGVRLGIPAMGEISFEER